MNQDMSLIFDIYTYPNASGNNQGMWEKKKSAKTRDQAFEHAERLFRTCKFRKVQIEQKRYDFVTKQTSTKTLKIFQNKDRKQMFFLSKLSEWMGFIRS